MIEKILSCNIQIKTKDPNNLKKLLDLEINRKKYNRSDSEITIKDNVLIVNVFSTDIIALKATINNYINILELIKQTYEVEL